MRIIYLRSLIGMIGLVFLSVFSLASTPGGADPGAFLRYEGGPEVSGAVHDAVVNAARVSVDVLQLERGLGELRFELPNGEALFAAGSGMERRDEGDIAWRGWIGGVGEGRVVLTLKHGLVAGLILGKDTVYELTPDGEGFCVMLELDQSLYAPCETCEHSGPPWAPPSPSLNPPVESLSSTLVDPPDHIDIMTLYTPQARSAAGGHSAIQATIQSAVDVTNTAFMDSNMVPRFYLVHTEEADHNDTGNLSNDIDWLVSDSTVATLRDTHGADLFSLIVENGGSSCGLGYVMRDVSPFFADVACQVTDRGCAVGNLSWAHEHGHNMGFEHDPANGTSPGNASYTWSFGHFVDGDYRTVMSYSNQCNQGCTRVAHFSNPDINHMGFATGIDNERDNARSGDLTADTVANFRSGTTQGPEISLNPTMLTPSCNQGQNASNQSFTVRNSGQETLTYTIFESASWLACSPTSGSSTGETDTITVTYSTSGLTAGVYATGINVSAAAASNSPQILQVELTVSAPLPEISVDPATFAPTATLGQNPPVTSFEVWNSGAGILNYTITPSQSWLKISPTSGSSSGEHDVISLIYETKSLSEGIHNAIIRVESSSASNTPLLMPVVLNVAAPPPEISLNTGTLNPSCMEGENAPQDSFEVWNSGSGTLDYTVTETVGWLACTPTNGSSSGEHDAITVTYTTSGLIPGVYAGVITVMDPAAANTPQSIVITLTVETAPPDLPGDCDGNGTVTIGEVQRAINMFLGAEPIGCGVDVNSNGSVSIGEVQQVINAFLGV